MTLCPLRSDRKGFTLAELLIALAILGVIATFTIPKILQSQQDTRYKSMGKEVAAMVSEAYEHYQVRNGRSANVGISSLTPYMNYITVDTVTVIDHYYGNASPTRDCANVLYGCLRLHNGGMLRYDGATFGGSAPTNAVWFQFDPDGKVTDGTTNGPGKALPFYIYYDGKLRTAETAESNTCVGATCSGPVANSTPPWFSWD